MASPDLASAVTAVFIVGMIWIRTRMQYMGARRPAGGKLHLERAGRLYFACVVAVLLIGWFAAPLLGTTFWPGSGTTPVLTRVIWFLTSYYLFILIHRYLKSQGIAVFKTHD
jgi:hypothetical protein